MYSVELVEKRSNELVLAREFDAAITVRACKFVWQCSAILLEGKSPLYKSTCTLDDNIKTYLVGIGCQDIFCLRTGPSRWLF
jgi:hypothetical protein